jgi:Holliday junction resolvase RusA-like endonuclease
MELKLVLPLPVSLNQLYINKYSYNPKTKRSEPTGARILSKAGMMSKKLIQKAANKQITKQTWDYEWTKNNFLYMDATIYFNRTNRDDNNIYKLLCDALEKIVYDNDSRILIRTQRIYYTTTEPRVELYIHAVDYIGIFDDEAQLHSFESVCKSCKRYGNNCSILSKAKEGRIQEEIVDMVCGKYTKKSETKKATKSK